MLIILELEVDTVLKKCERQFEQNFEIGWEPRKFHSRSFTEKMQGLRYRGSIKEMYLLYILIIPAWIAELLRINKQFFYCFCPKFK